MSGTSLDGLDVVYSAFQKSGVKWTYSIKHAQTISYSKTWKQKLGEAHKLSASRLNKLDEAFGNFIGRQVNTFIKKHNIADIDLVCSHGHTVFHEPAKGITRQIGSGAAIAANTGLITVCDFRKGDVALGGQGAPLVPVGDQLLFSKYQACLNIGGIANISIQPTPSRLKPDSPLKRGGTSSLKAFDICPANMVFNYLAQKAGKAYDKDGKMATSGRVNWNLLKKLNGLPFYKSYGAKSLGREWIEKHVIKLINKERITNDDKLATASEHAAFQTARVLNHYKIKNVLVTGGGAYNKDFIKRIHAYADCEIIIPDDLTIQFKEALVFAFLGVLRVRGEANCLKSVTGAKRDSCGGDIFFP